MLVYRATPKLRLLQSVPRGEVISTIDGYAAITGGSANWAQHGSHFSRTESLRAYAARQGAKDAVNGPVQETAVVEDGYLVALQLDVNVTGQIPHNKRATVPGSLLLTIRILRVNGVRMPKGNL